MDPATIGALAAVQSAIPSVAADTLKKAASRVIGSIVAGTIGHSGVGQQIRDNLDEQAARSKVNSMLAEEVGRQAVADPKIVERFKARILGDLWSKQENVEATTQKAKKIIDDDPQSDEKIEVGNEPSGDWLGSWKREAENATSDELRDRLAAVLAGEIKRPGSYSRATIRLVGDLERETIERFRSVLSRRVANAIVTGDDWQQKSDTYILGLELEDAGLVSGTASAGVTLNADHRGLAIYRGNAFGIAIKGAGFSHRVPVWVLSSAGVQIANLLASPDETVGLKIAFEGMSKEQIEEAYLGPVVRSPQGLEGIAHAHLLWKRPSVDFGRKASFRDSEPNDVVT